MKKDKSRWKDLPFYERFARICKRNGFADWMVEHIMELGAAAAAPKPCAASPAPMAEAVCFD